MLIERTNIKVDLDKLRQFFIDNPQYLEEGRNSINSITEDYDESDLKSRLVYAEYKYILPEFKGTIIEEIMNQIPGKKGRARVHTFKPFQMLEAHRDFEERYHVAVFTDPMCLFIDPINDTVHRIPADGYVYKLDARDIHVALNATNNVNRTHLVICKYED